MIYYNNPNALADQTPFLFFRSLSKEQQADKLKASLYSIDEMIKLSNIPVYVHFAYPSASDYDINQAV